MSHRTIKPTPVVLLLLVVIAEFTLTLRGHAALGLQHLLCFVWSWLVSLVCVEVLEVGARVGANLIEVADGMVPLGHSAHTRVCHMWLEILSPVNDVVRTEIGESSWTSHHGHGVSSRRWAEELSALVEIIEGTINFYRDVSSDLAKLSVPMNAWDLISRPLKYHANTLVEGD